MVQHSSYYKTRTIMYPVKPATRTFLEPCILHLAYIFIFNTSNLQIFAFYIQHLSSTPRNLHIFRALHFSFSIHIYLQPCATRIFLEPCIFQLAYILSSTPRNLQIFGALHFAFSTHIYLQPHAAPTFLEPCILHLAFIFIFNPTQPAHILHPAFCIQHTSIFNPTQPAHFWSPAFCIQHTYLYSTPRNPHIFGALHFAFFAYITYLSSTPATRTVFSTLHAASFWHKLNQHPLSGNK